MREILFRGKLLSDRRWAEGNLDIKKSGVCIITPDETPLGCYGQVDPETVGQYTGMNDRHGKRIFENDIVEVCGGREERYLIWWVREMSMLTAIPVDEISFNGQDYWNGYYPQFEYSTFCAMMQDPWGDFRDIRVIGNIHDNPELIGGKEDGT